MNQLIIGYHDDAPPYAIQYRHRSKSDWHFGTPFAPDARECGSLDTVQAYMALVKRRRYSVGRIEYRIVSVRIEPI